MARLSPKAATPKIVESKPPSSNESAACERCGSFDVLEITGQFLCEECVALAGCGCAGHGEVVAE